MKDFKVRFWSNDTEGYKKVVSATYYCSGQEAETKNAPLCINTKDGQFIIDTRSVIKLLKKHGRI